MTNSKSINELASHYVPIFTEPEGLPCDYNIPTRVDFDGDWNASNNAENYDRFIQDHPAALTHPEEFKNQGLGMLYYQVITSRSHAFITYYLFYPRDGGWQCKLGGHQNDASSVIVIVDRQTGKPDWLITQDHDKVKASAPDSLQRQGDHLLVEIKTGIHSMDVVKEGRDFSLSCNGQLDDDTNAYPLVSIEEGLWAERYNTELFCEFSSRYDHIGTRYCGADRAAWAPWARNFIPNDDREGNPGHSFFDPIPAFQSLYEGAVYSMDYDYNPYAK